jgi:Anti-sigma-K factor rskA/Putative zinc-finger
VNENCERIQELLGSYALGVLENGDLAKVEAHLERCPACREVAREHEEAVHALPSALAAASPVELPRTLRQRVLQQVANERGLPQHDPATKRQRGWWPRAAFAIATLTVAALFVAWDARLDDARSQERELRARLAKLQGLQPVVLEVVDSRHTVKHVLLPPEERSDSRAYGKVFTRTDLPDVVAMANRLQQPPPGQAYHLWATTDGRVRLIGVMPIDKHGFALLVFRAKQAARRYEEVRVLLQRRGARRPSGTPALVWSADT